MRVEVNLQNILDYSLDVITGNSRADLLTAVAKAKEEGYILYVKIPDAEGGDTEAPQERNTFAHFGSGLPEPDGKTHLQESVDLAKDHEVWCPNPEPHEPHHIVIQANGVTLAGGLCKGLGSFKE